MGKQPGVLKNENITTIKKVNPILSCIYEPCDWPPELVNSLPEAHLFEHPTSVRKVMRSIPDGQSLFFIMMKITFSQ